MKLSELKALLLTVDKIIFRLPDGSFVPEHFHVTEVGMVHKHFIDCGGTIRNEQTISFQLWYATDEAHRLQPQRLLQIIRLSEDKLNITDQEIEVEYQGDTIGRYGLDFANGTFALERKTTACLAEDACDIPVPQLKKDMATIKSSSCCGPGQC